MIKSDVNLYAKRCRECGRKIGCRHRTGCSLSSSVKRFVTLKDTIGHKPFDIGKVLRGGTQTDKI